MFGWDWGPTLPDMGIFRDAELFIFSGAMLDNLFITQKHTPDGVVLAVTPEYVGGDSADDTVVTLEGHVNHTAPFAGRMVPRRLVHAAKGGSAGIICQHLLLYKGASDNGVRRSDFGRSR